MITAARVTSIRLHVSVTKTTPLGPPADPFCDIKTRLGYSRPYGPLRLVPSVTDAIRRCLIRSRGGKHFRFVRQFSEENQLIAASSTLGRKASSWAGAFYRTKGFRSKGATPDSRQVPGNLGWLRRPYHEECWTNVENP